MATRAGESDEELSSRKRARLDDGDEFDDEFDRFDFSEDQVKPLEAIVTEPQAKQQPIASSSKPTAPPSSSQSAPVHPFFNKFSSKINEKNEISRAIREASPPPPPAPPKKPLAKAKSAPSASAGPSKQSLPPRASSSATPDPASPARATSSSRATSSKGKKPARLAPSGAKYTPLEEQVLDLKESHPDVLLAFEVGYKFIFYEEDAVAAARELNIACFPKNNLRVGSIPVHRLQIHARRLVNAGYKVGVVRQIETRALKAASSNASAPFTRELTELYTASTWVEDLDSEGNSETAVAQNSLVAITEKIEGGNYGGDERVSIGLVAVQAATGTVIYDQFLDSSMRSELETRLAHLQPAELILPPTGKLSKPTEKLLRYIADTSSSSSTSDSPAKVRLERVEEVMSYNDAFSVVSKFYEDLSEDIAANGGHDEPIDVDMDEPNGKKREVVNDSQVGEALATIMKMPHLAVIALAHCLEHLQKFKLASMFKTTSSFVSFQTQSEMLIAANTLYNLELFSTTEGTHKGSLFWLLDKTKTVFGRRLLRKWVSRPLTSIEKLQERTDAISELMQGKNAVLNKVPELLIQQPDLEKGLARMLYGRATPNELMTVLLALNRITSQFEAPDALDKVTSTLLKRCIAALPKCRSTVQRALADVHFSAARKGERENMFIDDKYPELQSIKDQVAEVDGQLHEHLVELRKLLKRPTLQYAKVAETDHLVELRTADAKKAPADWLRMSATKTMVRFHTPEIIRLLKLRGQHSETLAAEAQRCFQAFLNEICEDSTELRNTIAALGTLDALLSLASVAALPGYVKPEFVEEPEGLLEIKGMRHPMSEALHDGYVPNDVFLDGETRALVFSGPNMGGKSSTVRALALCVILGQIGSFVPADSAKLTIRDAVLTRMGASDELAKGRSTFMVEAQEAAEILRVATGRSLVILDELGRGTSTFDGQAIASSILTHLATREIHRRPTTLFITHYTSLCDLADRLPGVRNIHMQFVERVYLDFQGEEKKEVVFLYKLVEGKASGSFGIHCASLAGLPSELLDVATQRSSELETHTEKRLKAKREAVSRDVLRSLFAKKTDEEGSGMLEAVKKAMRQLGVDVGSVSNS